MGGFDRGLIVRQNAGFGQQVHVVSEIAEDGCLVTELRGESLLDLGGAAMAVHVSEAADVHENVEAQGGSGMERAQRLVVTAPMLETDFNDLFDARGGQAGRDIA